MKAIKIVRPEAVDIKFQEEMPRGMVENCFYIKLPDKEIRTIVNMPTFAHRGADEAVLDLMEQVVADLMPIERASRMENLRLYKG